MIYVIFGKKNDLNYIRLFKLLIKHLIYKFVQSLCPKALYDRVFPHSPPLQFRRRV